RRLDAPRKRGQRLPSHDARDGEQHDHRAEARQQAGTDRAERERVHFGAPSTTSAPSRRTRVMVMLLPAGSPVGRNRIGPVTPEKGIERLASQSRTFVRSGPTAASAAAMIFVAS